MSSGAASGKTMVKDRVRDTGVPGKETGMEGESRSLDNGEQRTKGDGLRREKPIQETTEEGRMSADLEEDDASTGRTLGVASDAPKERL